MVLAGLAIGLMMGCCAEVASRFNEPGGAYLYSRTAFGRFAGIQVGWFSWLAPMGTSAAAANLFNNLHLGSFPVRRHGCRTRDGHHSALRVPRLRELPWSARGSQSQQCLHHRQASCRSSLLIVLGLIYFAHHPERIHTPTLRLQESHRVGGAMLLLSFAFGGFENAILPAGEVKDAQRTLPFALGTGLLLCILVYALVQFVSVATIGTGPVDRPLAASAALLLIGRGGAAFVAVAAMISTFGHLSAVQLATPRLTFALAQKRDFPAIFARMHPRFQTPYVSILAFGLSHVHSRAEWHISVGDRDGLRRAHRHLCKHLRQPHSSSPGPCR